MRPILPICILLLACNAVVAQPTGPWVRLNLPGEEEFGYKDLSGRTRTTFRAFNTVADTFRNIIAVAEGLQRGYYLLKNGRRAGLDSLYLFDYRADCESEGTIRFRSWAADRVGFLDSTGTVLIPAIYNAATPFYNGLAVAYRNGRRQCADRDTQNCEHWSWVGGENVLINKRNEILAISEELARKTINLYSMAKNNTLADSAGYITIAGEGGVRYSFMDYEEEFRLWLYNKFIPAAHSGTRPFGQLLFTDLVRWDELSGWRVLKKEAFLERYPQTMLAARLSAGKASENSLFDEELNDGIYSSAAFRPFYTDCGQGFSERYPVFTLVVTHPAGGTKNVSGKQSAEPVQDHFDFLRTGEGYRLIGVSFKD